MCVSRIFMNRQKISIALRFSWWNWSRFGANKELWSRLEVERFWEKCGGTSLSVKDVGNFCLFFVVVKGGDSFKGIRQPTPICSYCCFLMWGLVKLADICYFSTSNQTRNLPNSPLARSTLNWKFSLIWTGLDCESEFHAMNFHFLLHCILHL